MKARAFEIEGTEIQLPSHVELVEGLNERIAEKIDAYDSTTVTTRIAALDDVYLGLHAKADNSALADSCTTALKATFDAVETDPNKPIHAKYYKKTDTVDKAAADDEGSNFRQKYAKQIGTYPSMTVGNADKAVLADKAIADNLGSNIRSTYVKQIVNSTGGTTITYYKGDGTTDSFTTKDTTYELATADRSGLMRNTDKAKLDALSTDTSNHRVAYANTAGALDSARVIAIAGGASGSTSFKGDQNVTINVGSINADSITGGVLSVARGGTGVSNLDNVVAGKAKALQTARTISMNGGVTGSVSFDGSSNVVMNSTQLNVNNVNGGVLSTLNGGTGRTDGYAQGLAKDIYINGLKFDGASDLRFAAICTNAPAFYQKSVQDIGWFTQKPKKLENGMLVTVIFQYADASERDYPGGRSLLCASSTAYPIYRNNAQVNGGLTSQPWQAITFLFYNSVWYIVEAPTSSLAVSSQFAISGGIKANNVTFNGNNNVTLNAATLDFNGFNTISNSLPVANGGTGQTNGTVAKLTTAQYINGISFDGSAEVRFRCTCTTAADNAAKTGAIPKFNFEAHSHQSVIAVTFYYPNTAANPTLNINSTGAYPIVYANGQPAGSIVRAQKQTVLLTPISLTGNSYAWCIISDPTPYQIALTGAVQGTGSLGNTASNLTFNVDTTFDTAFAYTSISIKPQDRADYDSNTKLADLNNLTSPGIFFLNAATATSANWNHRPVNMENSSGHFLIVYSTGVNTVVQTLVNRATGKFWRRGFYTEWSKWFYFAGETTEYNA